MKTQSDPCLRPTFFIDSDHAEVVKFARAAVTGVESELEKGVRLYYAVRDEIRYNPYSIDFTPEGFKASRALERREAFCVPKAVLLAACARAVGIPSRLGFADVRNHLTSDRLRDKMGGKDLFVYHGMTLLFLNGKWVKCTPAFNLSLCRRANIHPLEFDGTKDSLFHPFDRAGNKHMEYIRDRGVFDDLPYEELTKALAEYYSDGLERESDRRGEDGGTAADFESEAY